jgi:hypothetical protein
MKIKDEVLQLGSSSVKDGEKTRFWEDTWVGSIPFSIRYPAIYTIVRDPHATVANVMATSPLNVSFRRALVDNNLNVWNSLVAQLLNVEIGEGSDTFRWDLTQTGKFSVKSMYSYLINTSPPVQHKKIWKLNIPLKIKIFLWYLQKGVIPTKDNLARKNWRGSQKCVDCSSNETIKHLFIECPYARMVWRIIFYATGLTPPSSIRHMFGSWLSNQSSKVRNLIWVGVAAVCWAIWRCRNDIIFHKIKINSILQVIFRGTYWLRFWAQLQRSEQAKDAISLISRNLETTALEMVKGGWQNIYRLL